MRDFVFVIAGFVATLGVAHAACATVLAWMARGDDELDDRVDGYPGAGAIIGVVERTIAYWALIAGWPAPIAAFLLVKTAARFGEASTDHRFAERFIVGTSISVGVAAAFALLVRWILGVESVPG